MVLDSACSSVRIQESAETDCSNDCSPVHCDSVVALKSTRVSLKDVNNTGFSPARTFSQVPDVYGSNKVRAKPSLWLMYCFFEGDSPPEKEIL
jgi:hypothetical protein